MCKKVDVCEKSFHFTDSILISESSIAESADDKESDHDSSKLQWNLVFNSFTLHIVTYKYLLLSYVILQLFWVIY